MLAVIEVGSGTSQPMCQRANRKPRHWPSDLVTVTVSPICHLDGCIRTDHVLDANLFKEAFIKAQQDNEKIFADS